MDSKAKIMIRHWVEMHRGDKEGVARWMRDNLRMGIRTARGLIEEALETEEEREIRDWQATYDLYTR